MDCKQYNTKMMVKDTRNNEDEGETYRRYVCPNCNAFLFTVEFEADQTKQFFENWQKCARKPKGKNDGATN